MKVKKVGKLLLTHFKTSKIVPYDSVFLILKPISDLSYF